MMVVLNLLNSCYNNDNLSFRRGNCGRFAKEVSTSQVDRPEIRCPWITSFEEGPLSSEAQSFGLSESSDAVVLKSMGLSS